MSFTKGVEWLYWGILLTWTNKMILGMWRRQLPIYQPSCIRSIARGDLLVALVSAGMYFLTLNRVYLLMASCYVLSTFILRFFSRRITQLVNEEYRYE